MAKLFLIALSLLLAVSCRKKSKPAANCTTRLYAYTMPYGKMRDTVGNCAFGVINTSSAILAQSASFTGSVYGQGSGAFNYGDTSYYVFEMKHGVHSTPVLYKINEAGAVSSFTYSGGDSVNFYSLVYNRSTGRLYAIKRDAQGMYLARITFSTDSFVAVNLDSHIVPPTGYIFKDPEIAVDNATGDMYYIPFDASASYIEKYKAASSSISNIAVNTNGCRIVGLCFNRNDQMLYGLLANCHPGVNNFIKISPASGAITSLSALYVPVDFSFYSACIHPCLNRYIISTANSSVLPDVFFLYQIDMAGKLAENNTVPTYYAGLSVRE